MAKNPIYHSQAKHIAIKYHYLRKVRAKEEIELKFCKLEEQMTDIFTRTLLSEAAYDAWSFRKMHQGVLQLLHIDVDAVFQETTISFLLFLANTVNVLLWNNLSFIADSFKIAYKLYLVYGIRQNN